MMRPYLPIPLLALLAAMAFLVASCDYAPAKVINCDMAEFHPDLVKYREQCRAMRGASK